MSKASTKMPRSIYQNNGPLSLKQAAEGINAAAANASRLLHDAKILLALGRYPSAAFLAAIAIEEHGKMAILDRLAAANKSELQKLWKEYRSHTAKNTRWILPRVADSGPKTLQELLAVFNPNSWHQALFEEIKQLYLYTDFLEEGQWSRPEEITSKEQAEQIISDASRLISEKTTTEEELAQRVSVMKQLKVAGSFAESKRILAQHLREQTARDGRQISEDDIENILNGRIDLRGAGRK